MTRNQRFQYLLDYFRAQPRKATTELHFGSAFQLLVATLLSAQCTDRRVNLVTPQLFLRFPDARSMAEATADDIFSLIRSVSYPNAKARHLSMLARQLVERHGGEVPSERAQLEALAGVGRKTANVVLAVWFGQPTLAVDTHVFRVSHRLGLVPRTADTPLKVEQALLRHIPQAHVADAHHWLLLHGRYICQSRTPHCPQCPFTTICPSLAKVNK